MFSVTVADHTTVSFDDTVQTTFRQGIASVSGVGARVSDVILVVSAVSERRRRLQTSESIDVGVTVNVDSVSAATTVVSVLEQQTTETMSNATGTNVASMTAPTHQQTIVQDTSILQDPHLLLANGGRADFRGKHNHYYNFLSSQNLSVNVKTENSSFYLGKLLVHGTFMTEAHVAMLSRKGRTFTASYLGARVNDKGWAWKMVNGSCAKHPNIVPYNLRPHTTKICDELSITTDLSSFHVHAHEWTVHVRGQPVYDHVSGPTRRVDVSFRPSVRVFAVQPHGIVGQSFDGSDRIRKGREDVYPSRSEPSEFTTRAMAEGAVDGVAEDYNMPFGTATAFKYQRFNVPESWKNISRHVYVKNSSFVGATDDSDKPSAQALDTTSWHKASSLSLV